MRKSVLIPLALLIISLVLTSCASTVEPSEAYQNQNAEQIFNEGEENLRDKNYSETIKHFEALEIQYPLAPHIERAQLHIIYAYYMKEEYPLAISAADRFMRLHPASPHVPYALYIQGLSNYYQNLGILERTFKIDLAKRDLTSLQKAFGDFSDLVARYPSSPYTPSAHQYMVYLRNLFADHELQVADYYYRRQAYVAAANRAADVVRYYEGASAVPEALVIMVKSYRKLKSTEQADDTLAVLQHNYPDSTYVRDATAKESGG